VTRNRKLVTAGCILAVGFVLAWPFRKSPDKLDYPGAPAESPATMLRASNGDPIAQSVPANSSQFPSATGQVMAHMASTGELAEVSGPVAGLESFDLANHPAIAHQESPVTSITPTPESADEKTTRPAYNTVGAVTQSASTPWPTELIHVVSNGDTLEKMAERYLHDAGRALEIFDLNRDQLSNPHLLPIGVELRIPANPERIID
jgi:nucleoid-associated protein YgaU